MDLLSSVLHCGKCANKCAGGLFCTAGKCAPYCKSGLTNCSGTCVNTQTDTSNCGKCGGKCAAGHKCSSGKCSAPASCAKVLAGNSAAASGVYTIDLSGTSAKVHCDMTTDGGGWTLVATLSNSDARNWSYQGKYANWLSATTLVKTSPDLTADYKSAAYGALKANDLLVRTGKGAWASYSGIGNVTFLAKLQSEKSSCNAWTTSAALLKVKNYNVTSMNQNLVINGVDGNYPGHCPFSHTDASDSHVLSWVSTKKSCQGAGLVGIGSGWEINIKKSGGPVICDSVNCWEDFTSDNQWKACSNPNKTPLSNNTYGEPKLVFLYVK